MTEALSIPRRIIRSVHAGIAGVFLVLIPFAIAGDEDLRAAIFQRQWSELKELAYFLVLASIFLAIALLVRRAKLALLCLVLLLDLPMMVLFWESDKGVLLAPVLAASAICILMEIFKLTAARQRQVA